MSATAQEFDILSLGGRFVPSVERVPYWRHSFVARSDQSPIVWVCRYHNAGNTWIYHLSKGRHKVESIELKFQKLADQWKREVGGQSSPARIVSNQNYLDIIALGEGVVPFILHDLEKEAAPWFAALRTLTKQKDIGREFPGQFRKVADAWITWGKENQII